MGKLKKTHRIRNKKEGKVKVERVYVIMRRTDLALEIQESISENKEIHGVVLEQSENRNKTVKRTNLEIINEQGSRIMGREQGIYVTLEMRKNGEEDLEKEIEKQLVRLVGKNKSTLIVGLGNREITPDSLGPEVVARVVVTRHMHQEFGKISGWENVEAIAPGVMAQTGMEVQEILQGIVERTRPQVVLVVDALAARSIKRLGCTVQITNTGIHPGAGVGNNRKELSEKSLGVPVIAMGIPTVVDAETIVEDYMEAGMMQMGVPEAESKKFMVHAKNQSMQGMFMAGRDIDEQVRKMSKILSNAMNHFHGIYEI